MRSNDVRVNNSQLIARFIAFHRTERGAGKNTMESYAHDCAHFAAWINKPFSKTLRADLQRYISEALKSGISARTAARRLSCLRGLFRFLIDEEEVSVDPTRGMLVPKSWKIVPRSLSQVDLDAMVASLDNSRSGIRAKAILLLLFASGLRESELIEMKLQDLDFESFAAKVWDGKGGKDGIVPLSPPAIAALKDYLEQVRPKLASSSIAPQVFLSRRGRKLCRQYVYWLVRTIARRSIGKHVSPHFLRHGFATALVEGGADIRDVQVLMRHSDVDTTAIYVHTDVTYLRRIYYASHPRARIAQA
jgi:integrase/recombinase XerD